MRARRVSLFALPLLALAAACGPAVIEVPPPPLRPPPMAATAPSPLPVAAIDPLADAPKPGPPITFVPPVIQEARLANGLRVLLVERHEMPIVSVEAAVDRGADQAPSAVGAFTGAMLLQGTKTKSAIELSDAFARVGGVNSAWVDWDAAVVSAQVLAPKVPEALALIADVLQNPAFDAKEIERERAKRITAVAQENDSPGALLSNAISKALYGDKHPYGASLLGDAAALKRVDAAALRRFHGAVFQPDHTTVTFAGDITKERAVAEVAKAFGAWTGKSAPASVPAEPPPPEAKEAKVVLIDRPRASQSSLAVTLPGVPRSSPDYDALVVMNTILGGQFSSRLNLNLREKHAYTYGASSSFDLRHGPGPFRAGGAIMRDATAAAAREIFGELDRIRASLVSEEELQGAKQYLVEQLPARFETTPSVSGSLSALAVYGLPLDEYATRVARFGRVTREDVQRVATTHLVPERFRLIIVGDAAAVREGLSKLAEERHLALEVREKAGNTGRKAGDRSRAR